MKRVGGVKIAALALLVVLAGACAAKKEVRPELLEGPGWTPENNNLHLIEGPPPGQPERAFRVYRSGVPNKKTFAKWCSEFGIERVIILSGDAEKRELSYQAEGICPHIDILANASQTPEDPLTADFLAFFDREIERARQDGVGILFRCQTGSHRAGRLAAYYQMKYQGLTTEEAIAVMDYKGMLMPLFDPVLRPQVRALHDYLHGQPCSQPERFCVQR